MTSTLRSYLYLHLAVIFWGFTAILGDLISLSAFVLVWWRVGLTSLFLLLWPGIFASLRKLQPVMLKKYIFIGAIVGLHWLSFYGSIKIANASVALVTLSTTALFTAFLEPWFIKSHINKLDVMMGLGVIPAMYLITAGFDYNMMLGFGLGILSAGLLALFGVLNRIYIQGSSPQVITLIEMSASFLLLTLLMPIMYFVVTDASLVPTQSDILYLAILVIGCTIIPFILNLKALKHLTAFTANLIFNLEPVYGILLAIVILKEHKELDSRFYIGVTIVMLIIFLHPILKSRTKKESL